MGRMQRNKGKAGERELAKKLTELFKVECRRRQQYNGTEGDDDVAFIPGVHVECKRTEAGNPYKWLAQAVEDSRDEDIPIVFHRRNREDWIAVVRLDDLPDLAVKLYLVLMGG